MFRTRYIIFILILIPFCVMGQAGSVVLDSITLEPLPRATVLDKDSRVVAVTSDKGIIPYISETSYPITIRYMGYRTAELRRPSSAPVLMSPDIAGLPEFVVESCKNKVLHILAYVREYSTLTTYSDTVFLFREKVVDYMLPDHDEKRFSGWDIPRIIASKSYYRFTNSEGLDSVSDAFPEHFSWCDWIGVVRENAIPLSLRENTVGTDTVKARYGNSSVWRRDRDKAFLDVDILADKTNYAYVPALAGYLDSGIDFRRLNLKYAFHNVSDTVVTAKNIAGYSLHIESSGRGRNLKRLFRSSGLDYVETYAEVYIVDSEYISRKEAKAWEAKNIISNDIDIELPADVPELDQSISLLVNRVAEVNHGDARLFVKPDRRLGREQKKRNALRYLKALLGIYSSKINYETAKSRPDNK